MIARHLQQLLPASSIQLTGGPSPGPSVAPILGVATSQGRAPALLTALGVTFGAVSLAIATVRGSGAVFAQAGDLMTVARLVGAGYLAWLAWSSFRKALSPPGLDPSRARSRSGLRNALAGFPLQIRNPMAIFFWLAVAALGNLQNAPVPVLAVFVLGAFINSFIGHGGYALLLSSGPVRRGYLHARRWIEAALGGFFAFAGFKPLTSEG